MRTKIFYKLLCISYVLVMWKRIQYFTSSIFLLYNSGKITYYNLGFILLFYTNSPNGHEKFLFLTESLPEKKLCKHIFRKIHAWVTNKDLYKIVLLE